MPDVYSAKVISVEILAQNVCSIVFSCQQIAVEAIAGQFVHIKCGCSRVLRRPVSICNTYGDTVRIVFEIKGSGTKWLSERRPGQSIDVLGPLGNGYTFPDGEIIVAGGGIGVPPLLFAAHSAAGGVTAVLGFRSKDRIILADEFKSVCKNVHITTDDGSEGIHGVAAVPLGKLLTDNKVDAVLSCGPYNMQKSVAALCRRFHMPCFVSLEERMGCGVGACLVCVCAITGKGDGQMRRVCVDGPVFNATEVLWK